MRAIFIVLLLMNVAFFAHHFFVAEKPTTFEASSAVKESVEEGARLQLLSELDHVTLKKEQEAAAQVDSDSRNFSSETDEGGSAAELCTMVGPYEQLLHAEYLVERLSALGVKSQITPVEIKEGDSYWVYLKPEISEKEALRRLRELQKKQIESHVISQGELSNGISLGRYADRAEAEIRLSEIKGLGYEALIKSVPKTINETWVVLDAASAEKIDENLWVELLSNQETLEKRQNYCLGVASQ